ncbi:MAG TPA: hypothetical protein VGD59_04330 [Acidisarcina sp.]
MRRLPYLLLSAVAAGLCFVPVCRADVALLVEDPAGYKGFWSDSGHLSIWVSDACVDASGRVNPCTGGSGVVLSSTSYWLSHGWAAIPAQIYLEGIAGEKSDAAWSGTLHKTYPELPVSYGRKYIARLDHRGTYVLRIHTTAEEDARVLAAIQQGRDRFQYAVWTSNCSDFARQVLELYFPGKFRRRPIPDFGISTPHGVANRFWKLGRRDPELGMRIYYIPRRTPAGHLHDGRTKGICEAAITDEKYALPLLFYHPLIYGAFGVCYLAVDQPGFMRRGFARGAQRIASFETLNSEYEAGLATLPDVRDPTEIAFEGDYADLEGEPAGLSSLDAAVSRSFSAANVP